MVDTIHSDGTAHVQNREAIQHHLFLPQVIDRDIIDNAVTTYPLRVNGPVYTGRVLPVVTARYLDRIDDQGIAEHIGRVRLEIVVSIGALRIKGTVGIGWPLQGPEQPDVGDLIFLDPFLFADRANQDLSCIANVPHGVGGVEGNFR